MKLIKLSLRKGVIPYSITMHCQSFEKLDGIQWKIVGPSGEVTYYDARKWNLYEYSEGWKKQ